MYAIFSSKVKENLSTVLSEVVKEVPRINAGGCGFMALHLGKELKEAGFRVEYLVVMKDPWHVSHAKNLVSNKETVKFFNTEWTHFMIRVNGKYYIDARGILTNLINHPTFNMTGRHTFTVEEKFVKEVLHNDFAHRWNHVFCRSKVRVIKKIIKKNLVLSK